MRVAPAALVAAGRIDDTIAVARRSARVTHIHPGALTGACVQAVAVALALRHPAGAPIDRAGFVAALRAVSDDPVLHAQLDLADELSSRGDAAEIATQIGAGILAHEVGVRHPRPMDRASRVRRTGPTARRRTLHPSTTDAGPAMTSRRVPLAKTAPAVLEPPKKTGGLHDNHTRWSFTRFEYATCAS